MTKKQWWLVIISSIILLGGLVWTGVAFYRWWEVHTGTVNEPGPYYGFWSGYGSVVIPPILNIVGIGGLWWWHHSCHEIGCLRHARYPVTLGVTTYLVCHRHHPGIDRPQPGHILKAWNKHHMINEEPVSVEGIEPPTS